MDAIARVALGGGAAWREGVVAAARDLVAEELELGVEELGWYRRPREVCSNSCQREGEGCHENPRVEGGVEGEGDELAGSGLAAGASIVVAREVLVADGKVI